MATINLGNIKFNWKGTYAGGTAYVVDDVVSYSGSSYICKLASTGNLPTNGTYWDVMSQAGTDGTNVGTTITTQGDLLYRDGSGLQRLAKPASNKFLQNTSGGVLSWETVSSKTLGVTQFTNSTRTSLSSADVGEFFSTNYTQIKANSKLRIDISIIGFQSNQGAIGWEFVYDGTTHAGFGTYTYTDHAYPTVMHYAGIIDGASSTGSKAWKYQWNHANNSSGVPFNIWNPTSSDDSRLNTSTSRIIITELDI